MDKIATNNFLVDLRDDVKASKAMVGGNFVRKIKELRKALERDGDSGQKDKTEKRIDNLHNDIKLLKDLDAYTVGKSALLKPDLKYWNDLIGDSKASAEAKVMARVIAKNRIQKQVTKFRSDHKDCDEWLEEYFEYREKKRELTEAKISKAKAKKMKKRNLGSGSNDQVAPNKGPRGGRPNGRTEQAKFNSHKERGNKLRQDNNPKGTKVSHNGAKGRQPNDKVGQAAQARQETLHPSWASKRKEKEILKAALSGKNQTQARRIILNAA